MAQIQSASDASMAGHYKSVQFTKTGGPEVLELTHRERRAPGRGEVLIRVLAIGMTQGDAMFRSGTYLESPAFPAGLGTEACGTIEAIGPGVETFNVGDRISVHSSHSINQYPLYGEYAIVPITSIVMTPKGLSDEEAGGFTLAFISMYLALVKEAKLHVGETVVLNAAGATTSLAACQIAKMAGAKVFGIVRTKIKAEKIADLGFDRVFVWDDATIVSQVVEASGGGVDIVMDPVLGPGSAKLSEMCRSRGRVVHYGALDSPLAQHSIYQIAPKFLKIIGFTIYGYVGSKIMGIPRDEGAIAETMRFINEGVENGYLKPLIRDTFSLEQIIEAHQALAEGSEVGKLIVKP